MSTDMAEPMDVDERSTSAQDEQASGSESESEPEVAQEDLMVVSRQRRTNAGNRMSTLIAQTAEEEEWGEEWEEAANEEEFVGEDANEQDDFNMESSSSEEEDEGGEDDTGEKELRKAERQERIKKRKPATNPFAARLAAAARKRVKLDVPSEDALTAPPPRPKKKSERASWIPTPEEGPVRTSSRRQTVLNKEHTLAKLKEKDRRRDDTLAMMKAAEARKAKDEPKTMSQAERLAEAARTERINSKSLHRWEEAEELRAAERQAKLDALKNRQIEGPFIRYYSGPAVWVDDKLKYTGKGAPKLEDLEEKLNKDISVAAESSGPPLDSADKPLSPKNEQSSAVEQSLLPENEQSSTVEQPLLPENEQTSAAEQSLLPKNEQSMEQVPVVPHQPESLHSASQSQPNASPTQQAENVGPNGIQTSNSIMFGPPQSQDNFLVGLEQYASQQQEDQVRDATSPAQDHPPAQHIPPLPLPTDLPQETFIQSTPQNPHQPSIELLAELPFPHPSLQDPSLSQNVPTLAQFQQPPPPPKPPQRKIIRRALRNLIILSSFPTLDDPVPSHRKTGASAVKEKDKSTLIQLSCALFGWSAQEATVFVNSMLNAPKTKRAEKELMQSSLNRKKELCAVTNAVARYRDPETGIAYRDSRAFSVLRGVVSGGFVWSGALGCYVGGRAQARDKDTKIRSRYGSGLAVKPAAGVPKRFLEALKPVSPPPPAATSNAPDVTTEPQAEHAPVAADADADVVFVKTESVKAKPS